MSRTGIMLAYPYDAKRLARWNTPWLIQPKLDGVRALAVVKGNTVILLSSESNPILHVPHIVNDVQALALDQKITLDGELYTHGLPLEEIVSIAKRTKNQSDRAYRLGYHIFDVKIPGMAQLQRAALLMHLQRHILATGCMHLHVVLPVKATTEEQIEGELDRCMKAGYEGIILREPTALYEEKRTTSMMKLKPTREDSYQIVDTLEEISIDGTPKNSLGALVLRDADGQTFKVGTGPYLTRSARRDLWQNRDNLVGRTAHIRYQALTEDRMVPRFPVLMEVL